MIYELRVYDMIPGKMQAIHSRFANTAIRYFEKYDIGMMGFWTDAVGVSNRLTYILTFDDMAQRDQAWAAYGADQDRARIFAEEERNGPLVARIRNTILRPTPYSPIQ